MKTQSPTTTLRLMTLMLLTGMRMESRVFKQARIGGEKTNGDESETESDLVRSAKETGVTGFERLIHTRKEAEAVIALAPPEQGFKALVSFDIGHCRRKSRFNAQYSLGDLRTNDK
jgi:hypothetical protein